MLIDHIGGIPARQRIIHPKKLIKNMIDLVSPSSPKKVIISLKALQSEARGISGYVTLVSCFFVNDAAFISLFKPDLHSPEFLK